MNVTVIEHLAKALANSVPRFLPESQKCVHRQMKKQMTYFSELHIRDGP